MTHPRFLPPLLSRAEGGALYALGLIHTSHGQGVRQVLLESLRATQNEASQADGCAAGCPGAQASARMLARCQPPCMSSRGRRGAGGGASGRSARHSMDLVAACLLGSVCCQQAHALCHARLARRRSSSMAHAWAWASPRWAPRMRRRLRT